MAMQDNSDIVSGTVLRGGLGFSANDVVLYRPVDGLVYQGMGKKVVFLRIGDAIGKLIKE